MIRYALACGNGHAFESWFPSSGSYDEQAARGLVSCPHCGSTLIEKQVMAPSLGRSVAVAEEAPAPTPAPVLTEPERRMRAMLRAVREHVEATAEHVGPRFPEEARKIHYGETDSRAIYGEASPDEARALIDEGIAVAALPPMPDDRN
ncbi:DUF1178 family protein [Methylobacterium sp. sgz302541]|uniref:DUF1178 family protein n=1 Tax=unclassified Methylobacterium TaxID=2615210 RepID=UPI003D34FE1F